jgi:hypothetical protein
MLTPYIFVACEKAIIGKDDVASLIGLFTKIRLNIITGTDIPKDAAAPKEWAIFSQWHVEPGDENKEYMLGTQILYPDKTQFSDIPKNRILVEAKKSSQVIIQVNGFPVGQEGPYTIRTWVEENKQIVLGPLEFEIEVEISKQEAPPKASNEANAA